MPLPMVEEDIARGALVKIELEAHPSVGAAFSMHAIYRKDTPPGPSGRWFVSQLKQR
ncbi:substrate-binding domain-containing protein [Polaromonas sp. P2-4]|nr:substrate-binding domain-containing protein [Polaromonas sp. P2-4]